ncbi:hypothetical protein Dimus_004430 [Dionaea muscipula]
MTVTIIFMSSDLYLTNGSSSFNPRVDEHQWVVQIRHILSQHLEDGDDNTDIPACIFNVPKALKSTKPECYTPQVVALGPYHSWRLELREMESYKLYSAKRMQKQLRSIIMFENLVEQTTMLEAKIRSYYHQYLDINSETLAWIMTIDSCFLLDFLQIYDTAESKMSPLVDYVRKRSTHNAILRDIVMVENQIPLFLLRKTLEYQMQSLELADDRLLSMLTVMCEDLFPFNMAADLPRVEISGCAHLLDFLYRMVVPGSEENSEPVEEAGDDQEQDHREEKVHVKLLCRLIGVLTHYMKRMILKLPWIVISNLPVFTLLKQPVEYLFNNQIRGQKEHENEGSSSRSVRNSTPPLMEEIAIPCVVELSRSGILFFPSDGDIRSISFNPKTNKFYLPTIKLDVNSEIILRNLVAYEASTAHGPLIFTRYTELMNGIIDTADDAKLLRKRGIILNHLKSDEEVANLWNGMSKSLRLTKVQFLDQTIEDVNRYHDSKLKVKAEKFIKAYVLNSWQFLAALFFLLLMTLQVSSYILNSSARTSRARHSE